MLNYTCLHFSDLAPGELYGLLALRQDVFIIEQNCLYQDLDQLDRDCWHVIGQDYDDTILAYARLINIKSKTTELIKIARVVTSKHIRREGEGKILMENSIEFARELFGHKEIVISAQTYLIHFYQNLGFETKGESFLEDGIPHIEMRLKA